MTKRDAPLTPPFMSIRVEDVDVYQIDSGSGWTNVPKDEVICFIRALFIDPLSELSRLERGLVVERPGFRFRKKEYRVSTHVPDD